MIMGVVGLGLHLCRPAAQANGGDLVFSRFKPCLGLKMGLKGKNG